MGKRSFAKADGALFNTKPEAEAAFTKWRECIPRFPNCQRVLSEDERKDHPYRGKTYILNDGKVVRIDFFTPQHSANRIWYAWDGTAITKVEKDAILKELYGISKEQIPDADKSQQAKLLEGHKTYEVTVALRGTIRLTGMDEDEAKAILDANWKDFRHSIDLQECEAVDVHEALIEEEDDDEDLDNDGDQEEEEAEDQEADAAVK